jgi:hypothetical protein
LETIKRKKDGNNWRKEMKLSNLGKEISQIKSQFNCLVKIAISLP